MENVLVLNSFPYFDEEIGSDVVFSGWARVVGVEIIVILDFLLI